MLQWCRSGTCVIRPAYIEPYHTPKLISTASKVGYDKSNFLESSKMGHFLHEYNYNKVSDFRYLFVLCLRVKTYWTYGKKILVSSLGIPYKIFPKILVRYVTSLNISSDHQSKYPIP